MDDPRSDPRRGSMVLGALLILMGIAVFGARQLNLDISRIGWPLWVIVPGVVLFLFSFVQGGRAGSGLAVGGGITTMTGLLLLYQDTTDHWQSWAYAWPLVAPGGVGIGLLLYGAIARFPDLVRNGLWSLGTAAGLFLLGAAFFEGLIGISGRRFIALDTVLPLALILLGVLIVAASFASRRRPVA